MNCSVEKLSKELVIVNELGLHARAAAMIAKAAGNAKSKLWIIKNEEEVDAASILDMLSLECSNGTKITLKVNDKADIEIFNNIAQLIENGFGE